ncbi:MAG: DUF6495 family protein [Crocinitomicaceae bacterium]
MTRLSLSKQLMVKYRLLEPKELKALEDDFVNYLVVQGITADEWEKLKKEEVEKAERITDLFSDVVFEKIMRNTQFLDFVSPSNIQSIQCGSDKMVMVGIQAKSTHIDLSKTPISELNPDEFQLFKGEKYYEGVREEELFKMTEKGYQISDGQLFKKLILVTVE